MWWQGRWTWSFARRRPAPGQLRVDAPRYGLVRALHCVVNLVEPVALPREVLERRGDGLFVEVSEQGLIEALVLALCGRLVGLTCNGFAPSRVT